MAEWIVEPPLQADFDTWRQLYRSTSFAIVVREGSGSVVGLAHFRPFARPLRASIGALDNGG